MHVLANVGCHSSAVNEHIVLYDTAQESQVYLLSYTTLCVKIYEEYAILWMILFPHPSSPDEHISVDAVAQRAPNLILYSFIRKGTLDYKNWNVSPHFGASLGY